MSIFFSSNKVQQILKQMNDISMQSSSSSSSSTGPNKKNTKKIPRKQRCLEELETEVRQRFMECYDMYQERKQQLTVTDKLRANFDGKLRELATHVADFDVLLPDGRGKFKYMPAVNPSLKPALHYTASNTVIANALYQFLRQTIYRESQPNAEKLVKEFIHYLQMFPREKTRQLRSNKIQANTFTLVIPKPRKRKREDTAGKRKTKMRE